MASKTFVTDKLTKTNTEIEVKSAENMKHRLLPSTLEE